MSSRLVRPRWRARFLGALTIRARVALQNLVMIGLILAVIVLSARSTSVDRQRALVNNVAGRQPELVARYLQEVLLTSDGVTADPAETYDQLNASAHALLDGGAVLAVQGNDREIHIGQQSDAEVRAKLTEEIRLIGLLGAAGEAIQADEPHTGRWTRDVKAAEALSHVTVNVSHDAVGAMTTKTERAVADAARLQIAIAAIGIVVTLLAGWSMSRHIVNRLRTFGMLAKATTAGDLTVRYDSANHDEIGVLGDAFNEMSASLSRLVGQLEADAERDDFGRQLSEAFEMVDDEAAALAIVTRAMLTAAPNAPTELLVTDSNQSELRSAAEHPTAGSPHCGVEAPFGCVAVRRGAPTVFTSSEALNACPRLRDRPTGPCSAVCTPVTFMGRALGVLHATGPNNEPLHLDEQHRLSTLASVTGARLGTVRAFNESQDQATTDPLTGLMNRRAIEGRLTRLLANRTPFALAMADLDHFKIVNDTSGHDAGDRALNQFSAVMKAALRADDLIARWGGEEFVAVFVGATLDEATDVLNRVRSDLAAHLDKAETPRFTSSFGLAHSSDHHGIDELVRAADVALYRAKENGRDQVMADTPIRTSQMPGRRLFEAISTDFVVVAGEAD
ncbi:MAG: diguanylate cyclase [Actinomycetota bacterium]|nr:diguanylate cyclase [Actinomycetota bacterium]